MSDLRVRKARSEPVGNEYVCIEHLAHFPERTPVPFCAGGRIEIAIGPEGGMFPCGRVGRGPQAPNVFEVGVQSRAVAFYYRSSSSECSLSSP